MRCNYLLIVQARQNSSRFPNKVLKEINGIPVINFLLKRLSKCKLVDNVVVAIPKNKENNELKNLLQNNNHIFFEGSESNVLKRFAHFQTHA